MPSQTINSQRDKINQLLSKLDAMTERQQMELALRDVFAATPDAILPDSDQYYTMLNYYLYKFILKHYQHGEDGICFWRFYKNLSADQLNYRLDANPELTLAEKLVQVYYYSAPLDDLTCLFVPIDDASQLKGYLNWIRQHFYDVNYPTSLLWLYALDSSMACLFPDEIVFLGKRQQTDRSDILLPDFSYPNAVLLKRYSDDPSHYVQLVGDSATYEFRQVFDYLSREYQDRCLSHSTWQANTQLYQSEWEKFEDVLRFGVSDKPEGGCISFSDLRSSTQFLNTYGKNVYLNKIQQPFFEQTELISHRYRGRIDKFMGDNVMCVFLNKTSTEKNEIKQEREAVLKNFFAVFWLCRVLYQITVNSGYEQSNLGLRSGMTYGDQILRSNLGNDIVRDFTVTGETVNLAARLEHITMPELIIHNQNYFRKAIDRFPFIKELLAVSGDRDSLNPETKTIINDFTVFQNIVSNLETLGQIKFDIRFNQPFYERLRAHLLDKGYELLNPDTASMYGYEQFDVEGFDLRFYFSYYNPKGFNQYERIWILPLDSDILINFEIDRIA